MINCSSCGKELDASISGECYSDNPMALTHSWAGIYCRDCYIKMGHKFCPDCNTIMMDDWKHCPECGKKS